MSKTQREQLVEAFLAIGEKIVEARTSKYIVMTRTRNSDGRPWTAEQCVKLAPGKKLFWFIGKSGGLRSGSTVSSSMAKEATKMAILARAAGYKVVNGVCVKDTK